MKWCRFEVAGQTHYGVVEHDEVVVVDGSPLGSFRLTAARRALASVKLLVPVEPRNFYAAGTNYREHIEWANRHHGMKLAIPTEAHVGYRSPNALIASGEDIVVPRDSAGPLEYEGELVAVVGRRARHVSERDALDCIAGYTLGNDLSERGWQLSDRTLWRAKNSDTFKPMGPFVVSGLDPMAQVISVRVNGETVSRYQTRAMLFPVAHWIASITRYCTLHPGDVLWLGSEGATLPALQPGDRVEVVNETIGVLANRVVREA